MIYVAAKNNAQKQSALDFVSTASRKMTADVTYANVTSVMTSCARFTVNTASRKMTMAAASVSVRVRVQICCAPGSANMVSR